MQKLIGIVEADAIWVREKPDLASKKIGMIYKNDRIVVETLQDKWIKHNKGGWSCTMDNNSEPIIRLEQFTPMRAAAKEKEEVKEDIDIDFKPYTSSSESLSSNSEAAKLMIQSMRGIHGMPYQYMPEVDRRLPGSVFGRVYADKIVSRMPLLLLTPGKPKFMKKYSDGQKSDILKYMITGDKGIVEELLNDSKDGKFYTFDFNYKDYYAIVNPMCQKVARFLNIQNETIDGTPLDKYEWEHYTNDSLKGFINSKESVAFYIDSETQISESFSNATGESLLSNKVNSLSDMGREIQFLLGGAAGIEFDKLKQENYDASLKEFDSFTSKYAAIFPKELMSKLSSGFLTVATGGKMIFPEIWNDSEFSRSYDITVKLRTPDSDAFSWYMNIAVPLLHLVALVAPQQLGANGYKAPFLVRGYYKGFFNVDMGIITHMNINKGDKGKWTLNGLPTEVDISFGLKDLYQILTLTTDKKIKNILHNTAMMDYLANMCGININKPDIVRSIDMYFNQITNSVFDKVTFDGFMGLQQWTSNLANSVFKRGL